MARPVNNMPPDQIAERDRDLVPQPPVGQRDMGSQQHSHRNDEHVHHGMLEALRKEQHGRTPDRENFPRQRRGRKGEDDGEAHHPIAEMPFVKTVSIPAEPCEA